MVLAFKIRVPDAGNIDKTFIFGADSKSYQVQALPSLSIIFLL